MPSLPHILAVDDEQRGVELVSRTLRKLAKVTTALSADCAWELFQQEAFDLVISDQRMPGMSGVELLTRVADRAPHTGRILLTGFTDVTATIEAINRGRIHAYVHKPCAPDQLRMLTKSILEQIQLQRTNAHLIQILAEKNDELEEVISSLRREQKNLVSAERSAALDDLSTALTRPLLLIEKSSETLQSIDPSRSAVLRELVADIKRSLQRSNRNHT